MFKLRNTTLALVLVSALALTALAITYGQPDGNRHPEVGALVGTFSSGTFPYCSGTLISPTVFLTAAHCNIGTSRVYVTFDTKYSSKSKLYAGTYYYDTQYNQAQSDTHDIAVVVFDKPITNIAPARLPTAGQLDALKVNQKFTVVGYGGQEPVNQPGGPVIAYLDTREFSTASLDAVNPGWLRLSQNPATGDGGACYGDSGGPNFLGAGASETNIIAGTTITGDALCKATNVIYRTDTASARNFLGGFVNLP
ncbi:MAG TPA: trypsin-like serine protease [Pyrinomonadaceae bacterium]|nr:trypsin-like serine protease [Pyrinomonadaceae bacterium]